MIEVFISNVGPGEEPGPVYDHRDINAEMLCLAVTRGSGTILPGFSKRSLGGHDRQVEFGVS